MKTLKLIAISVLVLTFFISNQAFAQKKWDVPAAEKSKVNPKAKDASVTALGKTEWNNSCKACHGKVGLDDGPKGKMTSEFASKNHVALANNIKNQTDGELAYKIKTGNGGGMPAYGKKLKDEDIWGLVNFVRTLQK
jgi:mono/diheme cytochrome c family protein